MRYKLKYSPDARDKLRELKRQITSTYGNQAAIKLLSKITSDITGLRDNPQKGPSVEALLEIPTPYRFIHVQQNYVFYRLEEDTIFVTDIYNEREDFMGRMFKVNLRTQDSIDSWGE